MFVRKLTAAALGVACLTGIGLAAASNAEAVVIGPNVVVNGDFSAPAPLGALAAPSTTDFALTSLYGQATSPGGGTMYDPGTYVVASNPNDFHPFWVNWQDGNQRLIANGFQNTNQKVWEQRVPGVTCANPASTVSYKFSVDAANILPLDKASDGGANISVTINGAPFGSPIDLTGNDPSATQTISGDSVPAAATMDLAIWNNGTAYSGNDFAIDNISLQQVGGCTPPPFAVPFSGDPTPPTCTTAGTFNDSSLGGTFLVEINGVKYYSLDNDLVRVSVERNTPGEVHLYVFSTDDGTVLTGLNPAKWLINADGRSATRTVTLLAAGTGLNCAPPCVPTAAIHQWYNWTGGPVDSAPAANDPRWHATSGDPRSADHKWENHPTNQPYQVGKGKGDWFKWETTPAHTCNIA